MVECRVLCIVCIVFCFPFYLRIVHAFVTILSDCFLSAMLHSEFQVQGVGRAASESLTTVRLRVTQKEVTRCATPY